MPSGRSFICYVGPRIKRSGGVYIHDSLSRAMKVEVCHRGTSQQGVAEQRALQLSHGDDTWLVALRFGLSLFVFES